ncbi:hypothetical protein SAMN04487970_106132 [Paenibacillus tianmuensis]|uniref:Uncharacterized protein n=1 Tax=Paenibacillus tianmuensis TaxID=624147 RepID=A0A1G4TQ14_9BACL|nr:hypothetical protein [Paenibacillus tianmuensis]SCW83484.1 hypothetical protein SAMN04487970_106132 [Paenibacillus tianmuensis]
MRRIMKKAFVFNKERYLFTLDTEFLKLHLNCYEGSSEKNEKVVLTDQGLRDKIFSLIHEEKGSSLAYNALRDPDRIDNKVRLEVNIPYPEMPEWDSLINTLHEYGSVEYDGDINSFINYLEYKNLKVVHFEHKNKYLYFLSGDRLNEFMNQVRDEVKMLNKFIDNIQHQVDYINRK